MPISSLAFLTREDAGSAILTIAQEMLLERPQCFGHVLRRRGRRSWFRNDGSES
jgi:hypothetical protein